MRFVEAEEGSGGGVSGKAGAPHVPRQRRPDREGPASESPRLPPAGRREHRGWPRSASAALRARVLAGSGQHRPPTAAGPDAETRPPQEGPPARKHASESPLVPPAGAGASPSGEPLRRGAGGRAPAPALPAQKCLGATPPPASDSGLPARRPPLAPRPFPRPTFYPRGNVEGEEGGGAQGHWKAKGGERKRGGQKTAPWVGGECGVWWQGSRQAQNALIDSARHWKFVRTYRRVTSPRPRLRVTIRVGE